MGVTDFDPRFDNMLGSINQHVREEYTRDERDHDKDNTHLSLDADADADARDTESALKTLFGEGADVPLDDGQLDQNQTLASAALSHQNQDDIELQIDPSLAMTADSHLADPQAEGTQTPPGSTITVKRKATSRANMLSRGGACEFCKRRKLKCSAEEPACSSCTKAGRECVYSQKKQRSRVKVLEDRLQELEKRLDHSHSLPAIGTEVESQMELVNFTSGTPDHIGPSTGSTNPSSVAAASISLYDDNFTLASLGLGLTPDNRIEPDLMTLADAAAADTTVDNSPISNGKWPWADMTPDTIAAEIIKAAKGVKCVGERIIAHLIQLYAGPHSVPFLHPAIPPATLISRMAPNSDSPIHPSLLLSVLPFLLPLSPSVILHNPIIPARLLPQSRALALASLASNSPQLLDLTAASLLRTYEYYTTARFMEGWCEIYSCLGMAHATGLSKLGFVGEKFAVAAGVQVPGRQERLEREHQLRVVRHKGVIAPPPTSAQALGHRIELFWLMYMADKLGSVGWGWPSGLVDDEITTPWPRDNYDDLEALQDNKTIVDFLHSSGQAQYSSDLLVDSDLCAQVKALTLLNHATRLFDIHAHVATPERTAKLIRLTEGYMSKLEPIKHEQYVERSIEAGPRTQALMLLYATMCALHAKDEIDAPPNRAKGHLEKSIEAAGKVVEYIQIAQSSGNLDMMGYDITAAVVFLFIGRFIIKISDRLINNILLFNDNENDNAQSQQWATLREKVDLVKDALTKMGRTSKFAAAAAQVVENISLGAEYKTGEWPRPDNVD